jgi:hypothetical protein
LRQASSAGSLRFVNRFFDARERLGQVKIVGQLAQSFGER